MRKRKNVRDGPNSMDDLHGNPLTKDYAERKMRGEALAETTQLKSDSETHPVKVNDAGADYLEYSVYTVYTSRRLEYWS